MRRDGDPAGGAVSVGLLVPASAAVVALALAAGLEPGRSWLVWLLMLAAMVQGALAGASFRRFWRGPAREAIFGAGGRYAGFLAAVLFSAVEAHAVGAGIAEGGPRAAVALLLPPVVLAAAALRSAVRVRREEEDGSEGGAVPGGTGPDDEPSTSGETG